MKKIYLTLAVVTCALSYSCSNDTIGDNPETTQQGTKNTITFGSNFQAVTRADATDGAAATLLGNQFKVYGVKQNRTTTTNYDKVFVDYTVTYSNNSWDYVNPTAGQYNKFWDYNSNDYHFVAGSPVANFSYALKNGTGDIEKATVTGLGGRLNPTTSVASTLAAVYIADPVIVAKANYNNVVNFTFRSMLSKVRVGIYETIPGYKITDVKFYNNASSPSSSKHITLNGTDSYFQGGSDVTAVATYSWDTPSYTLAYTGGITQDKCWKGGEYTGIPATSSAGAIADLYGADDDKDAKGYFIVMPTPSATAATPLSIRCDYTLTSLDNSGEQILVENATATIPSDYTKWAPNTAYTYLFKITDNNLHPITFDAVVVETIDKGTTTTVSTPSITVYQDGDVVDNGITYKAGDITVKAMKDNTDVTSSATWSYTTIAGTTYDYTKDYEHLGTSGAATSWTAGKLTSVTANNVYVLKCGIDTNSDSTLDTFAYFVLVVGAAENGPSNP